MSFARVGIVAVCLGCASSSGAPAPTTPASAPAAAPVAAPPPAPPVARAPLNATAPQAIAYAIRLLERKEYARLLEELSLPEDLRDMKAQGKFETTVRRFEDGWADILLGKLRRAQRRMPRKRADGALLFETSESGVPLRILDTPIVVVERDGHWYFAAE